MVPRDLITAMTHRVTSSVKLSRPWRGEKSSTVAVTASVTAVTDPLTTGHFPQRFSMCKWTPFSNFICRQGIPMCLLQLLCFNFVQNHLFWWGKIQKTSFGHRTPVPTCFLHNFFVLHRNRVKRKPKFHIFCLFSNGIGIF